MGEGIRTVPNQMLGCWKRRYIKFNNGKTDTSTRVVWLQTLSGMVDIRIPLRTLDFSCESRLEHYSLAQLTELAAQDCGTGVTKLDTFTKPYATASWSSGERDAYIQPVENFPEDGWFDWQEEGRCMMEWAPSGAYQEDWRLLNNSRGYVADFHNVDPGKKEFVYVAGDHAVYVRGRDGNIEEQRPLQEIVQANRDNEDYIRALVDVEFSYALRNHSKHEFNIELSTLPYREGQQLNLSFLLDMGMKEKRVKDPHTDETWQRISQWRDDDAE